MADTRSVFLFCLCLIFIVSSSSSSSSSDFDTFQLVVQWAPSTCSDTNLSQQCSRLPDNKFTIRGLWPTRLSPFQIVGPCEGSKFDRDNILPIQFGLNLNWPDLISGNNEELWREEWEKHGTCSEDYLDQSEFFTFTLNSFHAHNIFRILERNGITPTHRHYRRVEVEEAINRAIGVRPAIRCNFNNLSKTQQLHEIALCYFKETTFLRNCPARASTCPNSFDWFPYMRTLYGYFQLALQWQPATCFNTRQSRPCLQGPENRFSLNGVWPTTRANAILGHCNGSNFDVNEISFLRARLNRGWPDILSRRNEELWQNEWRNFGTCSEDQFGQRDYFSFAVHAFETHNMIDILRRSNIVPNGQSYRKQEIENAIIRSIGTRPILFCNTRRVDQRERRQLHQIVVCYDDYARQLQDCPERPGIFDPDCPALFHWFT